MRGSTATIRLGSMTPGAATSVRQRLEELADEVESSSHSAAERLRDLGDAVDGGQAADIWASADIFQLIDPDTIAEQVRTRGIGDDLVKVLELLRNALVFLPIAVTWIGIWLALESYGAAIQANPALAEQSFLFLWQQGFEGRMPLTLSTIALIDGFLLSLVFVLTLIVLSRNNQKDRHAEDVRDDLASVLADASLVLTHRRTQQNLTLTSQFERVAQELLTALQEERTRIQDLASRKEKEVGDLAVFTRDFMAGMQTMLSAVQALQQMPQQLGTLLNNLAASFQQLADQQRHQQQDFAQATQQAATQIHQLMDTHRAMSVNMQAMGTNLQSMGTGLQAMGSDLRDAIQVSKSATAQTAQAISDMRTIAANLSAAQTQFLASLSSERGSLEQSTQEMQQAVQALQHTYQALDQSISSLARLLQQMSRPK